MLQDIYTRLLLYATLMDFTAVNVEFEFQVADQIVIEFDCIARRTMQTDMVDNRINCITIEEMNV